MTTVQIPRILIEREGNLVAVRTPDETFRFSTLRRARFTRATWLRRAGEVNYESFPESGATADAQMACDTHGCNAQVAGKQVAIIFDLAALPDDCALADIVIAPQLFLPASCNQPALRIDRRDLIRDGAHAILFSRDSFRLSSANEVRGQRPWVPQPDR